MNSKDILQLALAQGVVLYIDPESAKLKFKARPGGLDDRLRGLIKQYRADIIAHLNATAQADKGTFGQAKIALSGSKEAPLSFPQQRLWFIDQMEQGSAQFNLTMTLDVKGDFNPDIAERVLQRIVARHQVLRTVYQHRDDGSVQLICDDIEVTLTRHQLAQVNPADRAGQLKQHLAADSIAPFDLSCDPMLRCSYIDLGEFEGLPHGVLLFTMHHIASDGWSMDVLVSEFSQLYEASAQDRPDPLPALPVQYIDYALWQRNWLQGDALQRQLDYWDQQLVEVPQLHTVPLDKPRGQLKQYQGAIVTQQLDGALIGQLQQLARRSNMTLFMLLHGGLSLLVSRHSNSDDIVIGTMVANRRQVELERLIGFFVNILVLRVNTDFDSIDGYLSHVRQVHLDGQANQDVPFEQLVERLNIERSTAHTPLYQITLTSAGDFGANQQQEQQQQQQQQQQDNPLSNIKVTPLEAETVVAKVDINVHVITNDQGSEVVWTYDQAIFSQAHIEQLSAHFARLLAGLANSVSHTTPSTNTCTNTCTNTSTNTGTSIGQLPLLSDAEQDVLLNQFNPVNTVNNNSSSDTALAAPSISEQFAATAARYPQRIACVFGQQTLTFAQLNAKANQLAHWLHNSGLSCGERVGLRIERSLDMVVAILAIFKAGGVYVPLDPQLPQQRLAYIMTDADIQQVITAQLIDEADTDACSVENRQYGQTESAYVIYTSGTSGTPKGVLVGQQALVNFAQGFKQQLNDLQLADDAPWLWNASYAFDASLKNIACLCDGRKVVIASEQQSRDAQALVTLLADHQLTVFNGMPLLVEQMVDILAKRSDLAINLISSGDDIAEHIWQKVADYCQAKGTRAINAYGPTETTVNASYGLITQGAPVNIGQPVANASCYVLDKNHQLVPQGTSGELYVGGACLANGYLNRAALTAACFIDNPFNGSAGGSGKLYKTGDRVHQLADGKLVYQGRIDRQVKIRGYRIELAEIESCLATVSGFTQAVVVGQKNQLGHPQLVAYLVADASQTTIDSSHIGAELAKSLPEYMLPVQYVAVAQLPLTTSGKLDLAALPNPFDQVAVAVDEQPLSELEQTLCEIWAGVLKLERIGVNDNFFMLGGDSIMSMQLVAKAKRKGLIFNVRQLFKAKTVAKLAPLVTIKPGKKATVAKVDQSCSGQQILLPIQQDFLNRPVDNKHHFNQSVLLQIPAGLTPSMIEQLTEALYRRHDVFRLAFTPADNGQWQAEYLPLNRQMLADSAVCMTLEADADQDSIQSTILQVSNDYQRRFNLAHGGLFKVVYFDGGSAEPGRLLLLAHHLVMDGVSWRIILADLEQGYGQLMAGQAVKLEPAGDSYQQWGRYLQHYAQGQGLASETQYWLDSLSHNVAALPGLKASGQKASGEKAAVDSEARTKIITLDKTRTGELLTSAALVYGTQVNELLLAALSLGLKNWSGHDSHRITMEGHGRETLTCAANQPDITETVGWFTSKYPLTLIVSQQDCQSLIVDTIEQYRALPNKGMGYGLLKTLSNNTDHTSGDNTDNTTDNNSGDNAALKVLVATAPSQLLFNYLGRLDQVLDKDSVIAVAEQSAGDDVDEGYQNRQGLVLNGMVAGDQLTFYIGYGSGLFDDQAITDFGACFLAGLEQVIDHCSEMAERPEFYEPLYIEQGAALSAQTIDSIMVKMNQSSGQKSIFCAPPLSGESNSYLALAAELEPVASVYGLQFPDLHSVMKTRSLEQLAAFYITLIKKVQPQGPYGLMGWSAGGTIAYEIAAQLRLLGDEVELLAILDQFYYRKGHKAELNKTDPYRNIKEGYARYIDIDWLGLLERPRGEALDLLVDKIIAGGHQPDGIEDAAIKAHFSHLIAYPQLSDQCQLKSSDVNIQLFQTQSSVEQEPNEPQMRWDQICSGDIKVIAAQGKHSEMVLAPNVHSLAKSMTAVLATMMDQQTAD